MLAALEDSRGTENWDKVCAAWRPQAVCLLLAVHITGHTATQHRALLVLTAAPLVL